MIVRGKNAAERAGNRHYDVCVIGGGPAGIIVCSELIAKGARVCLIESGDLQRTKTADSLREVVSKGIQIREDSRERLFGGATAGWAGLSAPLDPIDFEKRSFADIEGWPLSPGTLQSYMSTAAERYGFPPMHLYEASDSPWNSLEEKYFAAPLKPTRFGRKFAYLFDRVNADLYAGATVLRLVSHSDNGNDIVSTVECKNLDSEFSVRADTFVLAAGGIENPRILLSSKTHHGSLGNAFDQVGRYFMNHPKAKVGTLVLNNPKSAKRYFQHTEQSLYMRYAGIRILERLQRERNLLNAYIRLEPIYPWSGSETWRLLQEAVSLLKRVLKQVARFRFVAAMVDAVSVLYRLVKLLPRLLNVLYLLGARGLSFLSPLPARASVRCFIDMAPRSEHRVTISDTTNGMGAHIPVVAHSLCEEELRTVRTLLEHFSKEVQELGIGVFTYDETDIAHLRWSDASHHMGGTRMGANPRTSVVDENLRIHGSSNVYIAGSSVFPSGGCANPTLVIAALSVRLAEHLSQGLQVGGGGQAKAGTWPVLVFGAGRRVAEDVVPVLEKLSNEYHIGGIFAQRPGVIIGQSRMHQVRSMESLRKEDLDSARVVYVAVPPEERKSVLSALACHDTSRIILILDTPVRRLTGLSRFAAVYAAEDMTALPWLDLFKNKKVTEVECDRSVYEYHGVALARALCRATLGTHSWIVGYRRGNVSRLVSGRLRVQVREPRDYERGTLRIVSAGAESDTILCVVHAGFCRGFLYGNERADLTQIESDLAGEFLSSDTVVTKMLALKRVGLYRMFKLLREGGTICSYSDGRRDVSLWGGLRHLRFWVQRL